jgi:hypothetical protein
MTSDYPELLFPMMVNKGHQVREFEQGNRLNRAEIIDPILTSSSSVVMMHRAFRTDAHPKTFPDAVYTER